MATERPVSTTQETTQTTVHVFHTGAVNIDRALAFREQTRHPMPYTGWLRPKSKRMWVPVSAYLIDHPEGPVFVDTGWHSDIRTDQRGHLGFLSSTMYWGRLPAGQAVHEQLASLGVRPEDLEYVVMSHLHSDHASGLAHVRDAEHIVVSASEWDARNDFGYIPSMWDGIDVTPLDLTEIPFGPFKQGLDLFGDGLVYLVFTPGHSAGHVSVLTKTGAGWVLLAGDVGYAAKSWEGGILPGVTTNDRDMHASLTWVKDFATRDDCVAAFANHDPDVTPTTVG
ncbi:MBL fold metallo-hydrolase [Haloferax sp. MBLA0076]|uniref:MBL fold metallo-hydrolase n=1 Tax=Haloferax litoreum TaxID=2666140 RepID=A0A6A8GJ80_9EURY|nr:MULTISPECIES: N-acyl homoserine lactonase family protein [Haloferax]KAB1194654.1 N-acyl homoserine lactonase family protein [Haloferax sp. CBA1148]MRX23233.1 MBL fold metallo-hydrolase [Haloferax litoreum]